MNANRITVDESSHVFRVFARDLFPRNRYSSQKTFNIRFRALFTIKPEVCIRAWYGMQNSLQRDARPFHLLWAVLFRKTYGSEHVNSVIFGVDAKTFRKWSWTFVGYLSNIDIVRCKNTPT